MSKLLYTSDNYCKFSVRVLFFLLFLPVLAIDILTIIAIYYATVRWENILFCGLPLISFAAILTTGSYVYNLPEKTEIYNDKIIKYERSFPNPFTLDPIEIKVKDINYVVKYPFALKIITSDNVFDFYRSRLDNCGKIILIDIESFLRGKRKKIVSEKEYDKILKSNCEVDHE